MGKVFQLVILPPLYSIVLGGLIIIIMTANRGLLTVTYLLWCVECV